MKHSYTKKNKKRIKKNKKMNGGLRIKNESMYSVQSAYDFFIDNSICYLLSYKSRGGLLFKLRLKQGVMSPYMAIRSNYDNKDINEVILKISFLNDELPYSHSDKKYDIDFDALSSIDFQEEVDIQTDIYNKSLDMYFEPVCPSITYSEIKNNLENTMPFFEKLLLHTKNNNENKKKTFEILKIIINSEILLKFNVGIIMMESLENFINVSDAVELPKTFIECCCIYELYRLYKLGYIHGDPHKGNFMINENYKYLEGCSEFSGRVIIIDFGKTFKHKYDVDIPIDSSIIVAKYNIPPDYTDDSYYQWLNIKPALEKKFTIILTEINECRERAKGQFLMSQELLKTL